MIEYRKARPDERSEYIRFADTVFLGDSFEQILPKVYGTDVESSQLQTLAVDSEKGICGMIAVLPGVIHAGDFTLKSGFIGTVAVDPDARGRGIMKNLMNIAIDDMRKDNVDIAILHGQRQRYEFHGFVQGGSAYDFRVGSSVIRHALRDVDASKVRFSAVEPGGEVEKQLAALHESRPLYYERDGFCECCKSFLSRLLAATVDGKVIGWIVCSGRDTRDDISEIEADSIEHFDMMLKAWCEQNGVDVASFTLPAAEHDVVKHICTYSGGAALRPCDNIRVFNHARVAEALMTLKAGYSRLENAKVSFDIEGECFSIEVSDGKVTIGPVGENPVVLSQFDADMLFFYPHDYDGKPDMPFGWFPLPMHSPVPDSF